MRRKRLKIAKCLKDVQSMQATLMSDALLSASLNSRNYSWPDGPWASRGPWNADLVDHVYSEVQRFIDGGNLTAYEASDLLWSRATQLWLMGRFDEAAKDAAVSLELDAACPSRSETIEMRVRSLCLMRQHRTHLEMLD